MDDLFDDTPPYKLSRTSDPQTSKDAAKTVSSGNDRAEMLEAIQQAGTKGLTLKEMVIESFGLVNTIQAVESAVSVEALYLVSTK